MQSFLIFELKYYTILSMESALFPKYLTVFCIYVILNNCENHIHIYYSEIRLCNGFRGFLCHGKLSLYVNS